MMNIITYEELNKFNAAYAACIDENKLELWPTFFSDTCLYKVTTVENYDDDLPAGLIYADSKGMLVDRITSLREANIYERQRYRHIIGIPHIISVGDRGVQAQTPFIVTRIMRGGKMDLFATGKYIDDVVRVDSEIKLEKRIVACDSISFDTLLAIPL